ncbi:MAG: polyprenyl synthetase family protein [Paludibacteraceae bacterium]|nr:polyprenyl synthetase family protein [Paludibacteraceae bacterium]
MANKSVLYLHIPKNLCIFAHYFAQSMTSASDILYPIEQEFRLFEKSFEKTCHSNQPLLQDIMPYVLSKNGKRLRPQLVLLAAKLCRGVTDKTIDTAVAMEMLHTASLIHDDVVDNSPLRRGSETIHTRWTNKVAVLVGDYLLARVMQLGIQLRNTRILQIIANIGASLSSGELLQLHTKATMWINEEQYYKVIEQKTASLFSACTEAGAESAGATIRQTSALRNFGFHLGMCFQMKDDVLDYSDSEEIGKPSMADIRDGKATLPLLIALQRAPENEKQIIRRKAEELAHTEAKINAEAAEQDVKSFVLRYDGIRYAYQQMQKHKEQAIAELAPFHDSPVKQSLLALLDYSVNRLQ